MDFLLALFLVLEHENFKYDYVIQWFVFFFFLINNFFFRKLVWK
jgi:hypothetical protein